MSKMKNRKTILIIPAIDLLGNRVVRLTQGDERRAVVYANDPERTAKAFEAVGATWIHVVDLDGAFGRRGVNETSVERIVRAVNVRVQLGGGVRSLDRIGHWLDRGAARVVLGSAAVEDPDLVAQAIDRYGSDKIVVGIDVKDGRAAVHGWRVPSQIRPLDLAKRMESAGVRRAVVTDISSDGMLAGPRMEASWQIAGETSLRVIVSGGVSSFKDLTSIQTQSPPNVEGAILGKVLYERKIDLAEAVRRFQEKTHAQEG